MPSLVGSQRIDRTGYETEHLKVLEVSFRDPVERTWHWKCLCKHCGDTFDCRTASLPKQKGCGCAVKEIIRRQRKKRPVADVATGSDLLKRAWV
jgi:hypothetical protein